MTDEEEQPGQVIQSGPALSCALFNSTLRQVVSGHVDSSVCVWDVGTGRKRLQIMNAHGEEELTCMTLDSSQRLLITGARNGTIKVKYVHRNTLILVSNVSEHIHGVKKSLLTGGVFLGRCGTYIMA